MDAKTILITGANSGVGFEAAKALARRGAKILMVSRDRTRGEAARAIVAHNAAGPAPELYIADLASQAQTRNLAGEIRAQHARLAVLVNNAGGVFAPKQFSEDGFEMTFVINHLAPFLLTHLLLDLVVAAPGGRIINVVTEVYPGRLRFDNLQGEKRYNFLLAYMHSKLANIIFTNELARRLEDSGTTANGISPGPTITNFGARGLHGLAALMPKVMMTMPFFISADKGAAGIVRMASSPELAGVSGRLFLREREIETKAVTRDRDVARRLWDLSEQLTGLRGYERFGNQRRAIGAV